MTDLSILLAGFSEPQPFTAEVAAAAPAAAGVHVVLDNDGVLYVGSTGHLRRYLRQHLRGSRTSSVLHDQVGQMLDSGNEAASTAEIAGWLGRHTVSWRETDDPRGAKDALVRALMPCLNRQVPKPRSRKREDRRGAVGADRARGVRGQHEGSRH